MSAVRIDEVGGKSIARARKILAGIPGGVYRASYAALKRAGETGKTRAGQFAAAEYTISKGTFMSNVKQITKTKSDMGGLLSLSISFAGTVLPLLSFSTQFSKNGLVQTQVKRNGGAASLQHVFVANIFGSTAVFERLSTHRFPVEQKYGPSTGHMMQNEQVIQKMEETINTTFETRLNHEILRVLNGWGG